MQLKVCKSCKQEKSVEDFYIFNRKQGYRYTVCIECHKARMRAEYWKKKEPITWASRKARALMNSIRARDKDTDLTRDWLTKKIEVGVCEVTGLPFKLNVQGTGINPYTPSVDRIDPSKGYTQDNCQIVVWMYNAAKGNWSHEDVMEMVKALNSL